MQNVFAFHPSDVIWTKFEKKCIDHIHWFDDEYGIQFHE